jgi:ATP-dependent protease HslVU (ClpYQ) peptidase subunit
MTVVVAVRKGSRVVLAADTQNNFGSNKMPADNHRISKIRKIGSAYLGTAGWGVYDNILDDLLARRKGISLKDEKAIFSFFLGLWKALHKDYSFVNDQCDKEDDSPFGDLSSTFLVVNGQGIFYVSSDMSVSRFEKYFALGSGADFSLGALHALYGRDLDAETLARKAVSAAVAFNVHCGGEVEVKKIKVR